MSVYIQGLDMPENDYIDVRIYNDGWAQIQTEKWPYAKGFPVMAVQPHGKLIDADADVYNYTTTWHCHCSDYGNQIVMSVESMYDLPVIIPEDYGSSVGERSNG